MSVILGVDYASIDGNAAPNWTLAKEPSSDGSRLRVVGIRASYGTWSDTTCIRDWASIKAAGLKRLPYLYPRYKDDAGVLMPIVPQVNAAKIALDQGGGLEKGVDYPVCLDIEEGQGPRELNFAGRLAWYRQIWTAMKAVFGAIPLIYTSRMVWTDFLGDLPAPDLATSPLWCAKPWPQPVNSPAVRTGPAGAPYVPSPWGGLTNYSLYQRQGDATGWPGFTHTVDVSVFSLCKRGDKGVRVKGYQKKLGIAADGDFGPNTENAVKAFQGKHGLDDDGIIGPDTDAPLAWVAG